MTTPLVFEWEPVGALARCRYLGVGLGCRTAYSALFLRITEGTARFFTPLWDRDERVGRLGEDFDLVAWAYRSDAQALTWEDRGGAFVPATYWREPKDRLAMWPVPDAPTVETGLDPPHGDASFQFDLWCLASPERRHALVDLLRGDVPPEPDGFLERGEFFVHLIFGEDLGYQDSIEVICAPEDVPRVLQHAAWVDARLAQCEALDDADASLEATLRQLASSDPDAPMSMEGWERELRPQKVIGGLLEPRTFVEEFQEDHRFLSNFWPVEVTFEGRTYPSVEHAYQAAKTTDDSARAALAELTAAQAKRAGSRLAVRDDWTDPYKIEVMRRLVRAKFQPPDLAERLLATDRAMLVEGNDWGDTFWGMVDGEGQNLLGRILMEVRYDLKMGRL